MASRFLLKKFMSTLERPSSSLSLRGSLPYSSIAARSVNPMLKDLNEKRQNFRRNVVSIAAVFKEVRDRLASQEQSCAKETLTRQEPELKANSMETEDGILQKKLEESNEQLQAEASSFVKYVKELNELRTQFSATRASGDASAASAKSAELQCFVLLKKIDKKNNSLRELEDYFDRLVEQLDNLKKDLVERESSQKQLKDEILSIGHDIMEALAKAEKNKDCALRKILNEDSPENIEDEEIAQLQEEVGIMSANWRQKMKEIESQLEKQQHTGQELEKRLLKLEFCAQEAHSQMRKLERMGERWDKAIKILRDHLAAKK